LNPGAETQKHREAASDIWNVRESYLSLLTDIRDASVPLTKLRTRRDELQSALHKIYKAAPRTDDVAYGKAQTALKDNEELTFSDAEIDAFLPAPLRSLHLADPSRTRRRFSRPLNRLLGRRHFVRCPVCKVARDSKWPDPF
jgi:hypothetical protein